MLLKLSYEEDGVGEDKDDRNEMGEEGGGR